MIKVCVYAICKNEKKFLNKWFENMFQADYICVLDTGSTDGTYEELKSLQEKYPDKLIIKQQEIKPWRFDVARNESMKLIPDDAEILVCTDFDELFRQENWVETIKSQWISGETNRAYYNYAWSHNDVGECTDMFVYDKIHTRELKWIFPVHEVLWPVAEETLMTLTGKYKEHSLHLEDQLLLEHFQDKTKERKYYFDLLELAVKENPNNPHEHMLLAREYLLAGKYKDALRVYLETLKIPEIDQPMFRSVLLESLGRCADLYKAQKNYDEAIWYCQEFIKEDPTYREPYFLLGEMYNDMKMYTLAEAVVMAGFEYSTRKYSWIERATTWLGWGYDILSVSKFYLGKLDEALENINEALNHDPSNQRLLKNKIAFIEKKYNLK